MAYGSNIRELHKDDEIHTPIFCRLSRLSQDNYLLAFYQSVVHWTRHVRSWYNDKGKEWKDSTRWSKSHGWAGLYSMLLSQAFPRTRRECCKLGQLSERFHWYSCLRLHAYNESDKYCSIDHHLLIYHPRVTIHGVKRWKVDHWTYKWSSKPQILDHSLVRAWASGDVRIGVFDYVGHRLSKPMSR